MTTQARADDEAVIRQILVDHMGLEKFEDGNALIRTIIKNSAITIAAHYAAKEELAIKRYHDEITDNEKKVWIHREDYEKRLELAKLQARWDEVSHFVKNKYALIVLTVGADPISPAERLAELDAQIKERTES